MKTLFRFLLIASISCSTILLAEGEKRDSRTLGIGETVVLKLPGETFSVMLCSDGKDAIVYVSKKSARRCELLLGTDGKVQNSLFVSDPSGRNWEVVDEDGDGVP